MKKNLKKILAVLAVSGTFAGYVFSQKNNDVVVSNSKVTDSVPITSATPAATVSVSQPKPVIAPVSKSRPVGAFTDGTYTGVVSDAFYGNIQVQAIIRNGALADVVFLQYPNDRNHSVEINNYAMPLLKSEAVTAQSANVDTISGASASSQAFVQSLQSALNQAKV